VTDDRLLSGGIYPPIRDLRSIARAIGIAVVSHLWETAQGDRPDDLVVEASIDRAIWEPEYRPCIAG
jgi:hypothetical protein